MRALIAALCALSMLLPMPVEAKPATASQVAAAKRIAAAMRAPRAKVEPRPTPKARPKAKPKATPKARRSAWRAGRARYAARSRWAGRRSRRWRPWPGAYRREPYEVPTPVFIGDLFVQAEGAPLWATTAGGQVLGRLPRATVVTNMGKYGPYYKVEAPNGTVGFMNARALGPQNPGW